MSGADGLVVTHGEPVPGLPMVVALSPPDDAGFTVARLAGHLLASLPSELVYSFDADELFVYRSHPSVAELSQSRFAQVSLPAVTVHQVTDLAGSRFLLVTGIEPDMRWVTFAQALLELASDADVSTVWCAHAVPWPVPHTRPVSVWVSSADRSLLARYRTPLVDAKVSPAPMCSLLQSLAPAVPPAHVATARVPQYLNRYPYVPSLTALLETLEVECGLSLPAPQQDALLGEMLAATLAAQPGFRQFLTVLEEAFDAESESVLPQEPPGDLVAQVEQFLAEAASQPPEQGLN